MKEAKRKAADDRKAERASILNEFKGDRQDAKERQKLRLRSEANATNADSDADSGAGGGEVVPILATGGEGDHMQVETEGEAEPGTSDTAGEAVRETTGTV